MVKQTIKRRSPGFDQRAHGFRMFGDLLRAAEKSKLLKLERDTPSGDYIILPQE